MTGEEVPKDEQDKKDSPNLRLQFLERLQGIAKGAFADNGIVDDGLCHVEEVSVRQFQSSNGWVNAPDTWTCKLADSHNDIVKSCECCRVESSEHYRFGDQQHLRE